MFFVSLIPIKDWSSIIRFRPAKTYLKNERVARRENRGIHERDPCRLTWAISGDFRLVVLGILLYSCVLRTKTRSKIAPWQVQRSFARRICANAMKRPQTIRRYWQGLWRCIGANPSVKTDMHPFHVCLASFLRSEGVVVPVKSGLLHFSL